MFSVILKGLAIGLLLIFSVGPVIFTTIKQSINHGRRGGFSFIIGVWISDIIWIVLSNGFSEAIKILLDFKIPIGIAGCCFLIGMGIYFTFLKKIEPRRLQEPAEIAGDEGTGRAMGLFQMSETSSILIAMILLVAVIVAVQVVSAGDHGEMTARADVPTVQPGTDVLAGVSVVPVRVRGYDYRRAAFGAGADALVRAEAGRAPPASSATRCA